MKKSILAILLVSLFAGIVGAAEPTGTAVPASRDKEQLEKYIKLARLVFKAADEKAAKEVIRQIVAQTAAAAGTDEKARAEALAELTAALSAALTAVENTPYARNLHEALIKEAAVAGGETVLHQMSAARVAAATTSAVTERADYTLGVETKVSQAYKDEVFSAAQKPEVVLGPQNIFELKELYSRVLDALRQKGYQIKLDIDESLLDTGAKENPLGQTEQERMEDDMSDPVLRPGDEPTKPDPTPKGLR